MAIQLMRWEVEFLYGTMKEIFYEEFARRFGSADLPKSVVELSNYPTTTKKPQAKFPLTLTEFINESEEVKDYLSHYHKTIGSTKDTPRDVSSNSVRLMGEFVESGGLFTDQYELNREYTKVFLKFLGADNLDEFKTKYLGQNILDGYYYSNIDNAISQFSVTLWYSKSYIDKMDVTIQQVGFHTAKKKVVLTGKLQELNKCWTVRFYNNDLFFDLTVHMGGTDATRAALMTYNYFFAFITAISSNGELISLETILAKKENKNAALIDIKRYLNLKRNLYAIKTSGPRMNKLENLTCNGTNLMELQRLSGKIYRVLTAAPGGVVVQSKFIINEDYSAAIEIPEVNNGKPLLCKLSIPNQAQARILIHVHLEKNTLYGTTVIDYPKGKIKNEIEIGHGGFCVIDQNLHTSPIGNILVMCADHENEVVPKKFTKGEINSLLETPVSKTLYLELQKHLAIWRNDNDRDK